MSENRPIPIAAYLDSARSCGREEFLAREPEFILILQVPVEAEEDQVVTRSEESVSLQRGLAIARVAKAPGANGFPGMVTLGRTSNNDVWLPSPDISKFHAYFTDQGGSWVVIDAGSAQGTRYQGELLQPNSRLPLHSGARLSFGSLEATFLAARDFYDLRVGEA